LVKAWCVVEASQVIVNVRRHEHKRKQMLHGSHIVKCVAVWV
jgi:hypothetical protein